MVNSMFIFPLFIREKRENPCQDANDGIRLMRLKKRLVRTIVKNDEEANENSGGDYSDRDGQPNGYGKTKISERPEGEKGDTRVDQLHDALFGISMLIGSQLILPICL
jgi:hypothetical protein